MTTDTNGTRKIHAIETLWAGIRDRHFHEFLWWCLPAVLLAVALRALIWWDLPYAFYHGDTTDLLYTPAKWIEDGKFEIHGKKTFLTAAVMCVPFLLHVPVLLAYPAMQHFLGILTVVLVGGLVRLWFARWRWFIIPATLIAAANPASLFYEHTPMSESQYLFCLTLLALIGTWYVRAPSGLTFGALATALVLVAGARPEGRFFFLFGILVVVLMLWGHWRRVALLLGILVVLALCVAPLVANRQSWILMYASFVPLIPEDLRAAPGLVTYLDTIRGEMGREPERASQWRKDSVKALEDYLKDHPPSQKEELKSVCKRIAVETAMRKPLALPWLIYRKALYSIAETPADQLDEKLLHHDQISIMNKADLFAPYSKQIAGRKLVSESDIEAFVLDHYRAPLTWFNNLQGAWYPTIDSFRSPAWLTPKGYPGVPWPFLLGILGMGIAAIWPRPLRPFHLAWVVTFLAVFALITLSGPAKPRFRFAFEGFFFWYALLFADYLLAGVASLRKRQSHEQPEMANHP